ncbi:phosphate-starvation-inducible PsiE family protein [Klebsiella pneumoniae]|uniref:phosphate-starvation-inducible PsiE family protein n=1 Tax=Klebsiella pneumoniae TaxID=573 RepID=UPI003F592A54
MGGALLDPRLHSVEQVMLQADSALYQAKKTRVQPSCGRTSISELRGVAMKEKQADPIKTFRAQWAVMRDSIIQVKTVILIGLIALARKFVILDPETGPAKVAALAGATLALGATYWLLRERDDRTAGESSDDQS